MTSLVIEAPIVDTTITVICQLSYIISSEKLIVFLRNILLIKTHQEEMNGWQEELRHI